MIEIGEFNTLEILRQRDPGLFLGDDEGNEVLLPNRYLPEAFELGESLEVFVYLDNDERPVAVTDAPKIKRNGFALLRCNEVTKHGAFLDWGLVKELFCPFKEQVFPMKAGGWYLVHCYLDEKTNRLVASSKTNRFLDNSELTVKKFDVVDVLISHPSEIGMNVIVNEKHAGLIYKDEIYRELHVGDRLTGVVKKIRKDNKIDIVLGQIGYKSIEPNAETVLSKLKEHNGYLELSDRSSPEDIKALLQMSKKNFKKAIGSLYKQRLIRLKEDGIYLAEPSE